jgi:hypothetical protein
MTKTYKVLLEQMTPVYTVVTVTANDEEEAAALAEEIAEEEGHEWSHDRLPNDNTWSFIPPVNIFMPTEDEPPRVLGVCDGLADISEFSCWGSNIVTSDGIVAPHFMPLATDSRKLEDLGLHQAQKASIESSGSQFPNEETEQGEKDNMKIKKKKKQKPELFTGFLMKFKTLYGCGHQPNLNLNLHRDLMGLGQSTMIDDYTTPPRWDGCFSCAAAYMNAYNEACAASARWTEESIREMLSTVQI